MPQNKPRPYSTLVNGRIVWVAPGENPPPARKVRTRLETDDEFRRRIQIAKGWAGVYATHTGQQLDAVAKHWDIAPRKLIDEIEP